MTTFSLPLLAEPADLAARLGAEDLAIIDMRGAENYEKGHIPSAVNINYARIVRADPPVGGLLPPPAQLGELLGSVGVSPGHHVVAYDDEGGGRASRLLWTLDVLGHERFSLLNGGLHAWVAEGHPLESGRVTPEPVDYPASLGRPERTADRDYILTRLGAADFAALDVRSPAEYRGEDVRAGRGGHIPGAVNLDWVNAIDQTRSLRFQPEPVLRNLLESRGITPDREVVVYCQTHHRSSHTYMVLRSLGYPRIRGYPGAWSEWGNDPATPVES
mgnify:CR=1 FL=1